MSGARVHCGTGPRLAIGTAARVLFAVAACLLLASSARAQSSKLGPGPISRIELTDQGLVLTADTRRANAAPFSGPVSLQAAAESGLANVSARPRIKNGGTTLTVAGEIGGQAVADFFPIHARRLIRITNGDGNVTQIEVVRSVDGRFEIENADRSPNAKARGNTTLHRSDVDARHDTSTTLTVPTSTPAFKFVVGVTLPELPPGAVSQYLQVEAQNADTGDRFYETRYSAPSAELFGFHYLQVPPGTYKLVFFQSIIYGTATNPSGYLSLTYPREETFQVPASRVLSASLSAPPAQEFVDATITVEGLEPFRPSLANPVHVSAYLSSKSQSYAAVLQRDVTSSDPQVFEVGLVPGEYTASISASVINSGQNDTGSYAQFLLDDRTAAASMAISMPPVVRLSGALLDPYFQLPSNSGGQIGQVPYHSIGARSANDEGGRNQFRGVASLSGFARGYSLLVPRGSIDNVDAGLTVQLGRPLKKFSYSENNTGGLSLNSVATGIVFDGDRDLDVTVPQLPEHVTISGKVVDERGRAVPNAFVSAFTPSLDGIENASFGAYVISGSKGEFRLRVLPSRGYTIVVGP